MILSFSAQIIHFLYNMFLEFVSFLSGGGVALFEKE
jgi:hypothetical protein